jgi:RNA polymerase sigma factor (TIGR02999 family)
MQWNFLNRNGFTWVPVPACRTEPLRGRTGWAGGQNYGTMESDKITHLLNAHAAGDREALDLLIPLLYDEMRRLARERLRGERKNHTLSATALVHEAYLKLIRFDRINYQNSSHFFAIASQVMRNILVDYAHRQAARKRGGGRIRLELHESDAVTEVDLAKVLTVHRALERLIEIDERQVRVIECRFFGGLSVEETAQALGISIPTVKRDWSMARAWLNRELADEPDTGIV